MAGKKKQKEKNEGNDDAVFDERFIAAVNRPQFKDHKKEQNKVVLDDRFASVLTDNRFTVQTKDKYGRKRKNKKSKAAIESELSEFYTIEKPGEALVETKKAVVNKQPIGAEGGEDDSDQSNEDDSSSEGARSKEEDNDPASRIAYLTALSRGEIDVSDSSSDDDSSQSSEDDSDSDDGSMHGKAGILDPSAKQDEDIVSITTVPSPYMAVMNMDWSHVRAVDLFAILSSFTPPGSIRKVQIFPSDYGIERMEKEKHMGPTGLWKKDKKGKNPAQESDSEDSQSEDEEERSTGPKIKFELEDDEMESGFDAEKLRAYEASKLKYYFAVVEFTSPEHADVAYKEVDGMELEHSSASVDMRSIDPDQLDEVMKDRTLRDEALSIPSNYEPPEFVVNALQQTNVACTWDEGDAERERKLTRYNNGQAWKNISESEDLRAYLASDQSSDDDSEEESNPKEVKGSRLRAMLGLDSDDEDRNKHNGASAEDDSDNDSDGFGAGAQDDMQVSFVPGKASLEDKIREKIQSKDGKGEELTPWEKYLEKRKQKRRERRQAARKKGKGIENDEPSNESDDGAASTGEDNDEDEFFVEDLETKSKGKRKHKKKNSSQGKDDKSGKAPSSSAELALLVAGEEGDEDEKDYDMRALVRIDKLKGKKLKGARKRKQEKLAANTSGGDFKIDTTDNRFAAVLHGGDDRFGIDRTDPNYKDTEAMRKILVEQTKQRKAKRVKRDIAPNVSAGESTKNTGGAAALSSLVKKLKTKLK